MEVIIMESLKKNTNKQTDQQLISFSQVHIHQLSHLNAHQNQEKHPGDDLIHVCKTHTNFELGQI